MLVLTEIEKAIRLEMRKKALVAALFLVVGAVVIASLPKDAGVRMIGMLLAGVGLALLFHVIRSGNAKRAAIYLALKNTPKSFVWIFTVRTQRMPFGFFLEEDVVFFFRTIARKEYTIKIRKAMVEPVLNNLKRNFPHTTFGHSKELEAAYQQDPRNLRISTRKD